MISKITVAGLAMAAVVAQPLAAQELITNRPAAKPAAPAAKPATPAPAAAKPPVQAASADDGPAPLPANAPTDDYEFMGWCTGILTGHMQLFVKVKPELDEISRRFNSLDQDNKDYEAQQVEGRALLGRFRMVMAAAELQQPSLGPAGQASVQKGLDNWSKIDTVDKRSQAYSWMNFGLPEQCATKVAALEAQPYVPAGAKAAATAALAKPAAAASTAGLRP